MVAYTFAHAIILLLLFFPCRGTVTLTVKGEPIHIDARALTAASPTFTLAGIGTFDTTAVQSFTLLPGWEQECFVDAIFVS